ncbi:hypothetical protein ACFSTE_03350 [Aquimarina hainanensis]|uniref:Outer membrane protein beta-barrel domain-containing protein n=1 Tax=Aquimarina hainanensis TaxID=1578017 RepID=A0ABW5N442_9FLAO
MIRLYKLYHLVVLLYIWSNSNVQAQSLELFNVDYTHAPQQTNMEYNRIKVLGRIPVKLKKENTYFIPGVRYNYHTLQLQSDEVLMESPQKFHTIAVNALYTTPVKNGWGFTLGGEAIASSDFSKGEITNKELFYTTYFLFIKKKTAANEQQTSKWILGLHMTIPFDVFAPLPIISYYKKFHPNWSYTVGTPISNLSFYCKKKSVLKMYLGLDRFYATMQHVNTLPVGAAQQERINSTSMFMVLGALSYEYYITEHLLLYADVGYTIDNEIRWRNTDQENLKILSDENTVYLKTGLKFKI